MSNKYNIRNNLIVFTQIDSNYQFQDLLKIKEKEGLDLDYVSLFQLCKNSEQKYKLFLTCIRDGDYSVFKELLEIEEIIKGKFKDIYTYLIRYGSYNMVKYFAFHSIFDPDDLPFISGLIKEYKREDLSFLLHYYPLSSKIKEEEKKEDIVKFLKYLKWPSYLEGPIKSYKMVKGDKVVWLFADRHTFTTQSKDNILDISSFFSLLSSIQKEEIAIYTENPALKLGIDKMRSLKNIGYLNYVLEDHKDNKSVNFADIRYGINKESPIWYLNEISIESALENCNMKRVKELAERVKYTYRPFIKSFSKELGIDSMLTSSLSSLSSSKSKEEEKEIIEDLHVQIQNFQERAEEAVEQFDLLSFINNIGKYSQEYIFNYINDYFAYLEFHMEIMDIYLLTLLFYKNKKYNVIYAGLAHIEKYEDFFKRQGYKKAYYSESNDQVLKIPIKDKFF